MLKYVSPQMRNLKGGLYWNRQDFVEKQHQITSTYRQQHRSTTNFDQRAVTIARNRQRNEHPLVMSYTDNLLIETSRGPRENHEMADEMRRKNRIETRNQVLPKIETTFTGNIVLTLLKETVLSNLWSACLGER